jgi:hypothetical protein
MTEPIIVGDLVLVARGTCKDRRGKVKRTQRQSRGERRAIFWVEVGAGETHAFFAEELLLQESHEKGCQCGGCNLPW